MGNDGEKRLSVEARELALRLRQGEYAVLGAAGLEELVAWGLARPDLIRPSRYVAAEPRHVEAEVMRAMRSTVTTALEHAAALSKIVSDLEHEPRPESSGGVEWSTDKESATQRLTQAADAAETHIWTAHPTTRPPEYLAASLPRDIALLERGVQYRTIYPDSARNQPAEQEWAREVSERGGEVRTAPPTDIERMVIVDRRMVVHTDHVWGGSAFVVTHEGVVATFAEVYEKQWARAEPWMGGAQRPVTAMITDSHDRKVLSLLWEGKTDAQIASALTLSVRTVQKMISALYESTGTTTRFQLGAWWGSDAGAAERAQADAAQS